MCIVAQKRYSSKMGFIFIMQNIIYFLWKLKMIRGHAIDSSCGLFSLFMMVKETYDV